MDTDHIYQMDCVEGMRQHLPDNSIDLTVTSPPYDNLRTYDGYSFDFEATARELYRVTKPGGVVVWVVADGVKRGSESGTSFQQALFFKGIGFNLHDTMIYAKSNPVPQFKQKRYTSAFEYMFVFSKGYPATCNYLLDPTKQAGRRHNRNYSSAFGQQSADRPREETTVVKTHKVRRNIWTYAVGQHTDGASNGHPAVFPEALAEDHILSWSNPGDVVLDPFMGSGTTAKMAKKNGRRYVGFELSAKYVAIAKERLALLDGQLVPS